MYKYKQLTSEQRYAIDLGLENQAPMRKIAESIGVSPSTVSREIMRNKNKRGGYSWRLAHEIAGERKERLPGNRTIPESVRKKMKDHIRDDWSPEQVSGHLRRYEQIKVSHETIYKWIREDKQAGGNLYLHCRHKLKYRKRPVGSATNIPNRKVFAKGPKQRMEAGLEISKWTL